MDAEMKNSANYQPLSINQPSTIFPKFAAKF